jgi:hypothetical protein
VDEIPHNLVDTMRFTVSDGRGGVNTDFLDQVRVSDDPYAEIRVGSTVYHPRWGEGQVCKRSGMGDNTELTIRFVYAGTKNIFARYGKLRLLK